MTAITYQDLEGRFASVPQDGNLRSSEDAIQKGKRIFLKEIFGRARFFRSEKIVSDEQARKAVLRLGLTSKVEEVDEVLEAMVGKGMPSTVDYHTGIRVKNYFLFGVEEANAGDQKGYKFIKGNFEPFCPC